MKYLNMYLAHTWEGFPSGLDSWEKKNPHAMRETGFHSLGGEDPLEEGMPTHSSNLAWRIQWTGESGELSSMR